MEEKNPGIYHSSYLQGACLKYVSGPVMVTFGCQLIRVWNDHWNKWELLSGIIYIRLIHVGKHILHVGCVVPWVGLNKHIES